MLIYQSETDFILQTLVYQTEVDWNITKIVYGREIWFHTTNTGLLKNRFFFNRPKPRYNINFGGKEYYYYYFHTRYLSHK